MSSGITFQATSNNHCTNASKINELNFRNKSLATQVRNLECWAQAFPGSVKDEWGQRMADPNVKIVTQSWSKGDVGMMTKSGLVETVLEAYNHHHHLVLRPDDFWSAFLMQFSYYINSNKKSLGSKLPYDLLGHKKVHLRTFGQLTNKDFSTKASDLLGEQILTHMKDTSLREWVLPKFTTTTDIDRITASLTPMSHLQRYFKYECYTICGIPTVTLEGTPDDWADLRKKFDRVLEFELPGQHMMATWHNWLSYIGDNLEAAAKGEDRLEFWDHIVSHLEGGSGSKFVTGWISTFSVFSSQGQWFGEPFDNKSQVLPPGVKSPFPVVATNDLASGVAMLPVVLHDNGIQLNAYWFAGHISMSVSGEEDTVQPKTDWCIAHKIQPEAGCCLF